MCCTQEDNVSHYFTGSPSTYSDNSNDARTDDTNEADGDYNNVEKEHITAHLVPIEKEVPLDLYKFKNFNAQYKLVISTKQELTNFKFYAFNCV